MSEYRRTKAAQLKLSHALFLLCLNVGVRAPDAWQGSPQAALEAFIDPRRIDKSPEAAGAAVGVALEAQMENFLGRFSRLKVKYVVDPSCDKAMRALGAVRQRAHTTNSGVLVWYNGHGVPSASVNGEFWCFNDDYSQYLPLSMYSVQECVLAPAVYVFDCNKAGRLIDHFLGFCDERSIDEERVAALLADGIEQENRGLASNLIAGQELRDRCIVFASCASEEMLPTNPFLPADFFTSCLTAPLKTMLFVAGSSDPSLRTLTSVLLAAEDVDPALCDIPGAVGDKSTPLGYLDWLLTSVCDAMAYENLPLAQFQQLFREDITLAALCRNFFVAQRLMSRHHVMPQSHPPFPDVSRHPLWHSFDAAVEQVVLQLESGCPFEPTSFFEEQLCAAEIALDQTVRERCIPLVALPIVLQALLGSTHRERALDWLARYAVARSDSAVAQFLSIDALPYVGGLLRTRRPPLRRSLLVIWAHLLCADQRAAVDLSVAPHGPAFMVDALHDAADHGEAAAAAFCLTVLVQLGQAVLPVEHVIDGATALLRAEGSSARLWCAMLCGALARAGHPLPARALDLLTDLASHDAVPEVRAAAVFALGCALQMAPAFLPTAVSALLLAVDDGSALVRSQAVVAVGRAVSLVETESDRRSCRSALSVLVHDAMAQVARNARQALLASSHADEPLPSSGFPAFCRARACSSAWVGGVAHDLVADSAPPSPRPPVYPSSWTSVTIPVVGNRTAEERVAAMHLLSPQDMFRVRQRAELELSVAAWEKKSKTELAPRSGLFGRVLGKSAEVPTGVRLEFELASFDLGKAAPRTLLVDHRRDHVLFAASDASVGVWHVKSNRKVSRFRVGTAHGERSETRAMALLNPDTTSPLLLVASSDQCIRVWRGYDSVDTAQLCGAWRIDPRDNHHEATEAMWVPQSAPMVLSSPRSPQPRSPQGLFSSLRNSGLRLLNTHSNSPSPPSAMPVSPERPDDHDGDREVRRPLTGLPSVPHTEHDCVLLAWRQATQSLVIGRGCTVATFDMTRESFGWRADTPAPSITALHADAQGVRAAIGDRSGSLSLLDTRLRNSVVTHLAKASDSTVLQLGVPLLTPHTLVSAHADGSVRLFDVRKCVVPDDPVVPPVRGGATCAAIHKRLPLIAMGSLTQRMRLYDTNGDALYELRNHRFAGNRLGPVLHVAFDPYRPRVAVGGSDGVISFHSTEDEHG